MGDATVLWIVRWQPDLDGEKGSPQDAQNTPNLASVGKSFPVSPGVRSRDSPLRTLPEVCTMALHGDVHPDVRGQETSPDVELAVDTKLTGCLHPTSRLPLGAPRA